MVNGVGIKIKNKKGEQNKMKNIGKEKFEMIIRSLNNNEILKKITEINPENYGADEWDTMCENPTDDFLLGLAKWGLSYDSDPTINIDKLRITFWLHPDIWDGQLEFEFNRPEKDWISYQYDQGGAL